MWSAGRDPRGAREEDRAGYVPYKPTPTLLRTALGGSQGDDDGDVMSEEDLLSPGGLSDTLETPQQWGEDAWDAEGGTMNGRDSGIHLDDDGRFDHSNPDLRSNSDRSSSEPRLATSVSDLSLYKSISDVQLDQTSPDPLVESPTCDLYTDTRRTRPSLTRTMRISGSLSEEEIREDPEEEGEISDEEDVELREEEDNMGLREEEEEEMGLREEEEEEEVCEQQEGVEEGHVSGGYRGEEEEEEREVREEEEEEVEEEGEREGDVSQEYGEEYEDDLHFPDDDLRFHDDGPRFHYDGPRFHDDGPRFHDDGPFSLGGQMYKSCTFFDLSQNDDDDDDPSETLKVTPTLNSFHKVSSLSRYDPELLGAAGLQQEELPWPVLHTEDPKTAGYQRHNRFYVDDSDHLFPVEEQITKETTYVTERTRPKDFWADGDALGEDQDTLRYLDDELELWDEGDLQDAATGGAPEGGDPGVGWYQYYFVHPDADDDTSWVGFSPCPGQRPLSDYRYFTPGKFTTYL